MIFGYIAVGVVVQLVFYRLASLGEWPLVKRRAVCTLLVLLHLAVIPDYFVPQPVPGEVCGLPVLGIYLACWIYGIGATLVTHLITGIYRYAGRHGTAGR